uniref:Uncharacterized protein n=1 Tax=Pithovirus LCPAC103 TaxID=2506588 RepID=A0A481Z412_9VIRU|nr:MAG: hypothetical protein LCPAC103_00070 [Pithovirus LCPAC103]
MVNYRFPPASIVGDVLVMSKAGCMLSYVLNNNSLSCFELGDDATMISPCGEEITGVVMRKNPATLRTKNGIVCADNCVWGSDDKDRLLTFEAARDSCGRICGYQVSYIDSSITWLPFKSLVIVCGCGTLTIGAQITNGSGLEYASACIEFVDTNETGRNYDESMARSQVALEMSIGMAIPIRENKTYPISAPLHLKRGETMMSSIEAMTLSELTKYYSATIVDGYSDVLYGYEFVAPEFIPDGIMYVYSTDLCDNIMYEGRSHHKSVAACDTTQVIVAGSIKISVKTDIKERTLVGGNVNVEGIVSIENKTGGTTMLYLKYIRHSRHGGPAIRVEPDVFKQEGPALTWKIQLEKTSNVQQMTFRITFPGESRS